MDTPERNQIGTPISKIEESPFSNFINSLSPINPTKTIHISQTFGSLSYTSPPSVFTSPHVSVQKEFRLLQRHQASDLAKAQLSSDEGNKESQAEQALSADQQPENSTNEQVRGEGASGGEVSVEPLGDVSKHAAAELPRLLKYESGSPDCKTATISSNENNFEPDTSLLLVPYVQKPSNRGSFGAKLHSQETAHNEEATCDWQSLICGNTTDLFVFDSPNDAETSKASFQKSLEEETSAFASLLSHYPPDEANDAQHPRHVAPVIYNEACENIDQPTQSTETNELEQIDQAPENLGGSSMNEFFSGGSDEKSGNEPFCNLHRGLRRRCLDFEMPRPKKNIDGVFFPSLSSSLQNEEQAVSYNKQPMTPGGDSLRCMLPGIGLHLNALAAASKNCKVPNQETLSSMSHDPLKKVSDSTSFEKNMGPAESGIQVLEDSSQVSIYAATEELNPNSPKRKRRKFENTAESEGCKRCNCKKSKCLKLYCECFAAGVYCVEPCSCQDCFNKPIHEDTVLATRKQIESRNPLAFAPKVIRTSDSTQEPGEDSTRTPASARHKRGCNCKKSNCLKKYCECYQGGVGCSVSCRCEGCKNAFGRKDGPTLLLGAEGEMEEARAAEKHILEKSSDSPALYNDEDHNSEFTLPKTPKRLFRSSVSLPSSSKGKPPRSTLAAIGSSSCLPPIDGPGRSTFLRSQTKTEKLQGASGDEIPTLLQNGSPPSNVKTLSPNGKRVSPPHHENGRSPVLRSSRKLILQSIPSFPSLTPRR